MKKNIHPFLFSIYPILFLYSQNIDQTSFFSIILPLIISFITTLFLFISLKKLTGDAGKSGVLVSIILFLFFSYGHMHSGVLNLFLKFSLQEANFSKINNLAKIDLLLHIILFLLFILIILRSYKIIKTKSTPLQLKSFLNIVSIVLVIFTITNIFYYSFLISKKLEPKKIEHSNQFLNVLPDIYYIILDGYARSDILEKHYNYNNIKFDSFLENKGFFIAKKSYSNYAWTPLSLSSSLNFKYINYLGKELGKNSRDLRLPYNLIESNKTMHLLRSMGYTYVHLCSTWGATLNNKFADIKIKYNKGFFRDEYFRVLFESSMFKILNSFIINDLSNIHLYNFEKLSSIPLFEEPTFTFAHIILPHHPFIFNRNGSVKKVHSIFNQFQPGGWINKTDYLDQLIFVNKKIMKIVEDILNNSKTEPIIIIQSDHGPQLPGESIETFLNARMANYMAFYLPHEGSKYLYHEITPVNTFRIIFKHYFKEQIELINDRIYFSRYESPYNFESYEP